MRSRGTPRKRTISSAENSEIVTTLWARRAPARVSHRRRMPFARREPFRVRPEGDVVDRDDERAGETQRRGVARRRRRHPAGRGRRGRGSRICSHQVPARPPGSDHPRACGRRAAAPPSPLGASEAGRDEDRIPMRRRGRHPLPQDLEQVAADAGRPAEQFAAVDADVQGALSHGALVAPPPAPRPRERGRRYRASGSARACAQPASRICWRRCGVGQHGAQRVRHRLGLVRIDEPARVADDLRQRAAVGGDDRNPARHRFERRQPEALRGSDGITKTSAWS